MLIISWMVTFLFIIGLGIYAGSKIKDSKQWSGGDKTLGAFSIGSILGAWQIGGMSIVGAAQNGYNMGIAAAWYSLAGCFYFLLVALAANKIRENMPADSVPAYLGKRYSEKSSRLYSYVWLGLGFLYIPIQLLTISAVIRIVLPTMSGATATFIGLAIAAVYTGFGGMKGASVIGKIVCFGIYAILISFVYVTLKDFGGYNGLKEVLDPSYFKMSTMPTKEVVGWALGGIISGAVMQSVLQPVLAAKSAKSAKNGALLGFLIGAPICIFTAIIGMMAKASGMDLGDGATAFAAVINAYTSPVMSGVIFGITTLIICATMSTMMM